MNTFKSLKNVSTLEDADLQKSLEEMSRLMINKSMTDEEYNQRQKEISDGKSIEEALINERYGIKSVRSLVACGFGRREAEEAHTASGNAWTSKYENAKLRAFSKEIILLTGDCGTGKTVMSAKIAHDFLERKMTVKYLRLGDFFTFIKNTWKNNSKESELDVILGVCKPDLLILDEIQDIPTISNSADQWAMTTFNNLIDRRYSDMKATILITNHTTADKIKSILPNSTYSRILGSGAALGFPWESYRGRK